MKNECEIVEDLLPNYIENLVSKNTKEYIEEHIHTCNNCKRKLEIMKDNKVTAKNNDDAEEKIELDHLKKYRRKMFLPKLLAMIFGAIILIIVIILGSSFAKEYSLFDAIINNAQSKKEKIKALNNYSVYKISMHKEYGWEQETIWCSEYYYKDGKYKEVNFRDYQINLSKTKAFDAIKEDNDIVIHYITLDTGKQTDVYTGTKEIENTTINSGRTPKETSIDDLLFAKLDPYIKINQINGDIRGKAEFVANHDIREDRFKGIDCYVLRTEDENECSEIWIDKENYIIVREIRDRYGETYDEEIISFHIGNVTDKDVEFNQEQYLGYTMVNE